MTKADTANFINEDVATFDFELTDTKIELSDAMGSPVNSLSWGYTADDNDEHRRFAVCRATQSFRGVLDCYGG